MTPFITLSFFILVATIGFVSWWQQYDEYPGYEETGLPKTCWEKLGRGEKRAVYLLMETNKR